MARIGSVEIGAKELESIGKWLDKIFNSRIGLALFVTMSLGCFARFVVPELQGIRENTSRMAQSTEETRRIASESKDMLLEMKTECRLSRKCKGAEEEPGLTANRP